MNTEETVIDMVEADKQHSQIPMHQPVEQYAVSAPATPAGLLQIAVQRGASLPELERLMTLMERYDAAQAKKAFDTAKSAFGTEKIVIVKDKLNKQFGSKYSSIDNLVNITRPFLGKHGFSTSWDQTQKDGKITVTCRLEHSQGHFKESSFDVPPDKSGSKNALQEIKSAITYARVTTFESVTGLVSSDESGDDDGNSSTPMKEKPIVKTGLGGDRFKKALDAVRNGSITPDFIRERHSLTTDQDIALLDLEKEMKK